MAPILIEPLSEQAYELLRQLEALHILRVVPADETPAPAQRKWAGSLPATSAKAWDQHLQEIRGEWERNT
ncbi:hypothetical protein [Hymenobacter sp. PAMC 26628]|uniref:hypothetical protein n=1 Tax=Hymenobacter sp. PAMC 26628 TaxID=1484118 RepID=UPI00076FE938|nr:hypothetical protein [Hymenobacter sp. PAMC 26628]AMJ66532.1 hypothetical protein AXW84_14650 [Hymenobacter sp. PAMC 26628]